MTCPLIDTPLRRCKDCHHFKDLGSFRWHKGYASHRCKVCHNARQRERWHRDPNRNRQYGRKWKRENPGKVWDYSLWSNYRITPDQYDALLEAQGGGCAICGAPSEGDRRLSVDHDHTCCPGKKSCGKCVRGLLCGSCNRALGLFKDEVERMEKAISYLTAGQVGLG